MTGRGTNQFGVFNIKGTAKPSEHEGESVMHVEFRKRYDPTAPPAPAPGKSTGTGSQADGSPPGSLEPLPAPSELYASGVVCLRGKISKHQSQDLGATEMIHRISGVWSTGLDMIENDPDNQKGLLSKFEYEHKSMLPTSTFPVSGKYSGWFDLVTETGSRIRINESNVTLKFKKNNAGYHNVEGKGSNAYGKYTISGRLTGDNVITIFRHFLPRKIKASKSVSPPPPNTSGTASNATVPRRASSAAIIENPTLRMEDVVLPPEALSASQGVTSTTLQPIAQPSNAAYSAVSRGVLRVDADGSHVCNGKWAATREHFTSGQNSGFTFRLERNYVREALALPENSNRKQFPLDSAFYKGSFQWKKGVGRYQTIVDQQVVMRFCMNNQGSYNVYGKGVNAIGTFTLIGTLIMNGTTGGQVELYRMYPASSTTAPIRGKTPEAALSGPNTTALSAAGPRPAVAPSKASLPSTPAMDVPRRESTRTVKLPPRLEDDNPAAQLGRIMDKCRQILQFIQKEDLALGAFFSVPVDPVALGIPTYHTIIKEPMDLRTISRRMEKDLIEQPEEFARLMRLVFENAMKFNVDPGNVVHAAARSLLIQFNTKYRDVERMVQNYRRAQGDDKKDKQKRGKAKIPEKPKTIREIRLEEAQTMEAENVMAMHDLLGAASGGPTVSRAEFSMLLRIVQQVQQRQIHIYKLLAQLSPDEVEAQVVVPDSKLDAATGSSNATETVGPRTTSAPALEKRKTNKRKAPESASLMETPVNDDTPLTREEQELLTNTINDLPTEQLGGAIQIIREAASVDADEEEIDLDIDMLSAHAQRKLLRYVSKFIKKPKSKSKRPRTSQTDRKKGVSRRSTPVVSSSSAPAPAPVPAMSSTPVSVVAPTTFQGNKQAASNTNDLFGAEGSDSESDDNQEERKSNHVNSTGNGKGFRLGTLEDMEDDDEEEEDDDDDGDQKGSDKGFNKSGWSSLSDLGTSSGKKMAGLDDAEWEAARKSSSKQKEFEEQRKAREAKMKAEAEEANQKRLRDAAKKGKEIRAKRQEEEAQEAAKKKEKEKEEREALESEREKKRAQLQSMEQTVDMDYNRKIMEEYENRLLDKDVGGSSPSSDFGF